MINIYFRNDCLWPFFCFQITILGLQSVLSVVSWYKQILQDNLFSKDFRYDNELSPKTFEMPCIQNREIVFLLFCFNSSFVFKSLIFFSFSWNSTISKIFYTQFSLCYSNSEYQGSERQGQSSLPSLVRLSFSRLSVTVHIENFTFSSFL